MIKFKFFSILVIFLMVFSTMGGVSAVMTKDTKVVNVDNVIAVDNPTVKEIQNAIDSSNDGDTIVIKGSPTDNGKIKSDKVLTIKGEDCTFNKIHWIPTKDISFENITFKNSNSDYGGAINSDGSVNLTNCNFEENSADTEGGAVWAKNDVIVKNCSFNKNKCSGAYVIQCKGGAIYSDSHVNIIDSNFTGNVAADYGGAIYSSYAINATSSIFEDNIAEDNDGGAVYSASDCTLWIYYSDFINNKASDCGGAIYGSVCMGHCSLTNNSCSGAKVSQCKGGAIYDPQGGVQFNYCNFTGNVVADNGGAVWSPDSVTVIGSSFENNSANYYGGAIYAGYTVDIHDSNFKMNIAYYRGGAVWSDNSVNVIGSSFDNNGMKNVVKLGSFGGAIYSNDGIVNINYSNFSDNGAERDGGAIYCDDGIIVNNCSFDDNFAGHVNSTSPFHQCRGGAIYCDDGSVKLINCSFDGNYAGTEGGAVWSDDGVTVDSSRFVSNSVTDNRGGAIYMDDSCDLRVSDSAFYANHANDKGGAIYCEGNFAHIYLDSFNSFENNTAKEGSVVFTDGYFDSIKNNWWGSANPDWDSGLIVEWKAWPWSNIKHHDDSPLNYNPNL